MNPDIWRQAWVTAIIFRDNWWAEAANVSKKNFYEVWGSVSKCASWIYNVATEAGMTANETKIDVGQYRNTRVIGQCDIRTESGALGHLSRINGANKTMFLTSRHVIANDLKDSKGLVKLHLSSDGLDAPESVAVEFCLWFQIDHLDLAFLTLPSEQDLAFAQLEVCECVRPCEIVPDHHQGLTISITSQDPFNRGESGSVVLDGTGILFARDSSNHLQGYALSVPHALALGDRALRNLSSFQKLSPTSPLDLQIKTYVRHFKAQWTAAGYLLQSPVFTPGIDLLTQWVETFAPFFALWNRDVEEYKKDEAKAADKLLGAPYYAAACCMSALQLWGTKIDPGPAFESKFTQLKNDLAAPAADFCAIFASELGEDAKDMNDYDKLFLSREFWLDEELKKCSRDGFSLNLQKKMRAYTTWIWGAFRGPHDAVTGCWDARNYEKKMYTDCGNVATDFGRLKGQNNRCVDGRQDLQYVFSDLPLRVDNATFQGDEDNPICHHPLLCEISTCHGKTPSHTCIRPSHLIKAPRKCNRMHLKIQQNAISSNITKESSIEVRKNYWARVAAVTLATTATASLAAPATITAAAAASPITTVATTVTVATVATNNVATATAVTNTDTTNTAANTNTTVAPTATTTTTTTTLPAPSVTTAAPTPAIGGSKRRGRRK